MSTDFQLRTLAPGADYSIYEEACAKGQETQGARFRNNNLKTPNKMFGSTAVRSEGCSAAILRYRVRSVREQFL